MQKPSTKKSIDNICKHLTHHHSAAGCMAKAFCRADLICGRVILNTLGSHFGADVLIPGLGVPSFSFS